MYTLTQSDLLKALSSGGLNLSSPTAASSGTLNTTTQPLDLNKAVNSGGLTFPNGKVLGDQTTAPPPTAPPPSGGGGGATSAPTSNPFDAILKAAQDAKNNAVSQAGSAYNIGQGIYNQGMDMLGQKRKQFQDTFTGTQGDILSGYEKNRGQLQRSAQDATTRTAEAMRALGLGGSAVMNANGRQAQENSKALASTQDSRVASDRANVQNLADQNMWADQQAGTLQSYLQGLGAQKSAAESGASTNFSNIMNNVTSQIAALQAAGNGIGNYQANPIAVNADQWTSAVNNPNASGITSVAAGAQPGDNSNVSINPMDALLKKQLSMARGSMYTG